MRMRVDLEQRAVRGDHPVRAVALRPRDALLLPEHVGNREGIEHTPPAQVDEREMVLGHPRLDEPAHRLGALAGLVVAGRDDHDRRDRKTCGKCDRRQRAAAWQARSLDRRARAVLGCDLRVMAEDRLVHAARLLARVGAQLDRQTPPELVVYAQRVGLAATPAERQHQ